jgi:hypothetical protein
MLWRVQVPPRKGDSDSIGLFTVREQRTVNQNLMIVPAGPSVNLLLIVVEPWFPMSAWPICAVCLPTCFPLTVPSSEVAECWERIREGKAGEFSEG